MIFVTNTKPLQDALNLGVVSGNVSKFYQKSCLAQLTCTRTELRINLEALFINSEISVKGIGDSDDCVSTLVDASLLKQLVNTFDAARTSIEYVEGGVVIRSGSSKFTLPQMMDSDEIELTRPNTYLDDKVACELDKSAWKFVKDHQMYAIGMGYINIVYNHVWVSEAGDVLVSDYDNSIFTHSCSSNLGKTCLISDTIVNLFNSVPENTKLYRDNDTDTYILNVVTDSYTYFAQFTPRVEDSDGVGNYNSDIILSKMDKPADSIILNIAALKKFLDQANLLSTNTEDVVTIDVSSGEVCVSDKNSECKFAVSGKADPYSVDFKTTLLVSLISHLDGETVSVAPVYNEGDESSQAEGMVFWTDKLVCLLGGTDS